MSVIVILKSTINQEKLPELTVFLEANLPNVRGFKGCQNVTVLLNRDNGEMIFHETWKDPSAHADYLQSIQENGVLAALSQFLVAGPEISYLTSWDI
ncbi:MAG: antibiotic biosynthesis monooxygenase [Hahellaceae bacterium]|nr:antibiotic biosynthesis monooxygenase [Hahellaceae bacterium]